MTLSKKALNTLAILCTTASLSLNAFKPEIVNPRLNVIVGILSGISLGIFFANYFRKE